MAAIDVRQTEYAKASIESCRRCMERLRGEAMQIHYDLRCLSGMSAIRRRLDSCIEELQEESGILNQMTEGLALAVRLYERQELAIAEYAEEAKICTASTVIEQWDVPEWVFQILGQEGDNGDYIY